MKTRYGAGQEQELYKAPGNNFPLDWSRDGKYIVVQKTDLKKRNIWVLPVFGDRKPFAYLNSKFSETAAKLSPNGQWLAYVSDEINRSEVYLQTFPKSGGKIQVSNTGGDFPLWSRDGKELYYISADRKLMAVDIRTSGNTIQHGVAKALFPVRLGATATGGYPYDVAKDGRFLIPTAVEQSANVPFTVVLNWTAALKK